MNAKEWIIREDTITQEDRIERLQWLLEHTPDNEIWLFHDGIISQRLFEQTRYCFVYGQYLATITLGLSFVEHSLAALFYANGRNDLVRASLAVLSKEALSVNWINQEEKLALDQARKIRNDITHFRKPGRENPLEANTYGIPEKMERYFEDNARKMMLIVFHLLNRTSVR
jgi:hypothetical protein